MVYKYSDTNLNIPLSQQLETILHELNTAGYPTLIVGGAVRDAYLGYIPKDIDIEVYNVSYDTLLDILKEFGSTDIVGKSFGVVKFRDGMGNDYDFSIPRRDSKVTDTALGRGRGFTSEFDISITPEEAASRRDFTINSLAYNPITHELFDFFGGLNDLHNGILRATSPAFTEDPLRALRGMQFAARFNLDVDPETAEMIRSIKDEPLVKERISGEWMKLFTKGKYPSKGIQYLIDTGWIENYPELKNIVGIPQDPEHHPEGTVEKHTELVVDAAAKIADEANLPEQDRAVLIMAALTHDFGKAITTQFDEEKEKYTAYGHDQESVALATNFMNSIGAPKDLLKQVLPLVGGHMKYIQYDPKSKINNVRQLAEDLFPATIQQLEYLVRSDIYGRDVERDLPEKAQRLFEDARQENLYGGKITPYIRARDILEQYPFVESGKILGDIYQELYAAQLQGLLSGEEDAWQKADKLVRRNFLVVNGNDVMEILGVSGPDVGQILNEVWELQKSGEITSREGALSWLQNRNTRDITLAQINTIDELIRIAENELTISPHAIENTIKNPEFQKHFLEKWKQYYTQGFSIEKTVHKDETGEEFTETELKNLAQKRLQAELEIIPEEMGHTQDEQIYYLVSRAGDWMDSSHHFFVYLLQELGAEVENGKLKNIPQEWKDAYFRIQDLNKLFEWAYEQEYGVSFTRSYDMTTEELNTLKNKLLDKYTKLIGEPIKIQEENGKPFNELSDVALGKRDVLNPEYKVD